MRRPGSSEDPSARSRKAVWCRFIEARHREANHPGAASNQSRTRRGLEKQFASWLGLCPRQHESNRTIKKRAPRRGKNRVAIALRMAAQAAGRTQSALGQFYRRIKSRIGGRGAVTATAHKIARLVYRLLKYGTEYVRQSLADYEQKVRRQLQRSLQRKAAALGYQLVPKATSA